MARDQLGHCRGLMPLTVSARTAVPGIPCNRPLNTMPPQGTLKHTKTGLAQSLFCLFYKIIAYCITTRVTELLIE